MHETPADLRPLRHLRGTRDALSPTARLAAVRDAARVLRAELLAGPKVTFYRSFDLALVPYPRRYALRDACLLPLPFVHILNRLFVIQFATADGIKTLLAEPLDRHGSAQTPFFHRLAAPFGGSRAPLPSILWPPLGDVEGALEQIGLAPEDVDYITYDHLHTQDVRRWLGDATQPGVLPNARLLVTREEWAIARDPVPPQAEWYPKDGTKGVPDARVILLDEDVALGDGAVALIRTPGHTVGNHSIVAHTDDGLLVTSENGVAADCYAPLASKIPGVARFARQTGMEVVMNGNTLEGSTEQYLSMILEKELAGRCPQSRDFYNVYPSSELSAHPLSPGLSPTFRFGERSYGTPWSRTAAAAA